MAELSIKTRTAQGVTILDLNGKVYIGDSSVLLREAVRNALDSGATKILLNLAGVTMIDSSGIGEFVSSYTTSQRRGGQIKLLNLSQKITELLIISKLLTIFETFDNEQEAIKSFS